MAQPFNPRSHFAGAAPALQIARARFLPGDVTMNESAEFALHAVDRIWSFVLDFPLGAPSSSLNGNFLSC